MTECRNCGARLDGTFCPDCGQKNVDLERPITTLIGDVLKETFDLDGRASRTIRLLLTRPGFLTSEFLAGRRRLYTPPLRLYLVFSVSFFVVVGWVASKGILLGPGQSPAEHAASQAQFMANELPRLMFVLLPVFALLLKSVFRQRLYFDHLIFSLHLHCVAFGVLALMLPIEELANKYWPLMIAQIICLAGFLAYFAVAVRQVYRPGWVVVLAKSLVVLIGYVMVVSIVIESMSNLLLLDD